MHRLIQTIKETQIAVRNPVLILTADRKAFNARQTTDAMSRLKTYSHPIGAERIGIRPSLLIL
ncbi:hypothetical protein [Novipirellula galeiformis]|uniref:hypothetical protein n=1 Tax=Novipirellula galeiformis TaxID=2528004 RepID=UPI0011B48812|nr:hypothetical protein [Novipirellula galeiformis]